jgi:flagellar basal body P-ring formation protein FlgA
MWRAVILILMAGPTLAESVVATRTLRAQTVIGPGDVAVVDTALAGALSDPAQAYGLETRVAIYAGRPVRPGDLGAPNLVQRNQIVTLVYMAGGLAISTEGRALEAGAASDTVRVMNLSSRTTVSGRIGPDGTIYVGWEN